MRSVVVFHVLFLALLAPSFSHAQEKINYADHVLPLFRSQCLNCHNPDKRKGNLDLSTFAGALAGGGSGKVIEPGDPDGSLLYRLVTHADEPTMPPKGDKLGDRDLDLIKRWIANGVLESSGSTAIISNKPKIDLKVVASAGKPDGPPPMPGDLLLEPVLHTQRAGAVLALATSPWAPLVAIGGQKQVLLYNPQTRELLGVLPFPEGFPNVLRFSRSGKILLAAGGIGAKSGKVVLFDIVTGNRITEVGDELDAVLAADISPDQSLVALGGSARVVKVYATSNGAMIGKIARHTDWITAIAFSADGKMLATGDRNGGLCVWEAATQNELHILAGHKAAVTCARFRADSNVLATSGEDGDIKLWDMNSGKQAKSWRAHAGGVLSLDVAMDGRLVSAGRDKRARAWKPDGGPLKGSVEFSDIALHAAFENTEGKSAIGADWTGEVRVFAVDGKDDGKLTSPLDANPPSIAEQLLHLASQVREREAALEEARGELKVVEERLRAAENQQHQAEANIADLQELIDEAQVLHDMAEKSRLEAQKALEAVADGTDAAGPRKLIEQAESQLKIARQQLVRAREAKPRAAKLIEKLAQRPQRLPEIVEKARARVEQALSEATGAKQRVARLQAGQFFTQVYAARQELLARQNELSAAEASAKAAQDAAGQAVSEVPAFEKAMAQFPQRLKAAEAAIPLAQQSASAVANIAKGLESIAAERAAFVEELQSQAQKIAQLASSEPGNKAYTDAATAARTAVDLLAGEVKKLQEGTVARQKAATQAQAAVEKARADLEKEMQLQKDAKKTIESLRAAIPAAQAAAAEKQNALLLARKNIDQAKAKADQLEARYASLKQELGLVAVAR